jgi:tRNA pseudouridine38-40 synthase
MPNFRLTIAYDGTNFHGWQTQPGQRTVQESLESALADLAQLPRIRLNASGRTDTGVHAVGQSANFHWETKLSAQAVLRATNARLPEDVQIRACEVVPDGFDANRHARRKLYRYVLHDGDAPDLFQRRYCHHSPYRLDHAPMREACKLLLGTHDFRCFETEWPNRATSVRTITHCAVNRFGDWLWLDVEADGFLYNMVRAIAGTLINIGRGYWPVEHMRQLLESGSRPQAGPTAPARGLFLMRVTY